MSPYDLFGPPETPEEALDRRKRREAVLKAALPMIREARERLREARAIGLGDGDQRLRRAQKHLAVLEDDIETMLAMPPEGT